MKIQYYPSDLAYALDIGEIADMHVEILESGVQVLRIECLEKKKDEYRTVKVQKKSVPAPKPQRGRSKREAGDRDWQQAKGPRIETTQPMSIGERLLEKGKEIMSNKNKPPWME